MFPLTGVSILQKDVGFWGATSSTGSVHISDTVSGRTEAVAAVLSKQAQNPRWLNQQKKKKDSNNTPGKYFPDMLPHHHTMLKKSRKIQVKAF